MTSTKVNVPFALIRRAIDVIVDSAYIFIGGLNYELTEGDVIAIFSQCVFFVDFVLSRLITHLTGMEK